MFPAAFADSVIGDYTGPDDWVLDPFAGRGTSVFAAATANRHGVGIEVNPVGWIYGSVKLRAAKHSEVDRRLDELGERASRWRDHVEQLPPFFRHCFSDDVLAFLLAAREELHWRMSPIDRTTMAFILVYLHGKRDASLSNQLRQTKSMAPRYAIEWWIARNMRPPIVDPVRFLKKRTRWRYSKGLPQLARSHMFLGDCTRTIPVLSALVRAEKIRPARLLLTSPPYFKLTNYHYDQWLRLWMLGGRPDDARVGGAHLGKFESRDGYRNLLREAFRRASQLLAPDAVIYVRTGRQQFTYESTVAVLREVFPDLLLSAVDQPYLKPTQTRLFGDHDSKVGEVDLILRTV